MTLQTYAIRMRNRIRRELSLRLARYMVNIQPPEPLVSFTFDDFPRSALLAGGCILRGRGARGTYYVSFGLRGKRVQTGEMFLQSDIDQLLVEGHELGCHTYHHYHAWETSARTFEASVAANQIALQTYRPGLTFKTMSYPISVPRPGTKRRCGPRFLGCRAGGQTFNRGPTDRFNLKAFFLEQCRDHPDRIKSLVDANNAAKGWLIFATHDVAPSPTSFGCTPRLFEDVVDHVVRSGTRIVTAAEALGLSVSSA